MPLEDLTFARALKQRFEGLRAGTSVYKVWSWVARDLFDHVRQFMDLSDLIDQLTFTSSSTILLPGDHIVLVNNTSGANLTVTLPDPTVSGRVHVWIKDIAGNGGTYDTLVDPGVADIDGVAGVQTAIDSNYGSVHYYSDGADWHVLSAGGGGGAVIDTQRRVVSVVSRIAVPKVTGTLYMGDPPTSSAPLVMPFDANITSLTWSVNVADVRDWDLEVLEAGTSTVLATLTLTAGNTEAFTPPLAVPVSAGDAFDVRIKGAANVSKSAFNQSRATIETVST